MLEFRYDTQLLIECEGLDEDIVSKYFIENFKGDCLLAVGDGEVTKIHFHTNEPWNTALLWERYTTLLLRIWIGRKEDLEDKSVIASKFYVLL